jgi:hypothetical protein
MPVRTPSEVPESIRHTTDRDSVTDADVLSEGEGAFFYALSSCFNNHEELNDHLRVARHISEGIQLVNSIDNYIDTHRHDPRVAKCGKAAIVYSILQAERASLLAARQDSHGFQKVSFSDLDKTWFIPFGRMLVNQVSVADLESIFSNISIICFNYDRCIEQFLTHWLSAVYAIDLQRSQSIVANLTILRPYGSVGEYFNTTGTKVRTTFDDGEIETPIHTSSTKIKTYTEQIADDDLLERIRSAISLSDTIVFLGFAFHPQNMEILRPTKLARATRIYASACGFSKEDAQDIEVEIRNLLNFNKKSSAQPKPIMYIRADLTCSGIFSEFSRGLIAKS